MEVVVEGRMDDGKGGGFGEKVDPENDLYMYQSCVPLCY